MSSGQAGLESESEMESHKENDLGHKTVTSAVGRMMDEGNFEGCTTQEENIRNELKDETAATIRVGKLLLTLDKHDENRKQVDEEIR